MTRSKVDSRGWSFTVYSYPASAARRASATLAHSLRVWYICNGCERSLANCPWQARTTVADQERLLDL